MAVRRARPRSWAARTCRSERPGPARWSIAIALVWHRVAGLQHVGAAEGVVLDVAAVRDLEGAGREPAEERDLAQRIGIPDQLDLRVLGAHRADRRIARGVAPGRRARARHAAGVGAHVAPKGGRLLEV